MMMIFSILPLSSVKQVLKGVVLFLVQYNYALRFRSGCLDIFLLIFIFLFLFVR